MPSKWKKQVVTPSPKRSRQTNYCEKQTVQQCQKVVPDEESTPKPRPQGKVFPWPRSLCRPFSSTPYTEALAMLRGARLAMAVQLPGKVLGAHVYRSVQRVRRPRAESEALQLGTEDTGLEVQDALDTDSREEHDSEEGEVYEIVYDHVQGQQ